MQQLIGTQNPSEITIIEPTIFRLINSTNPYTNAAAKTSNFLMISVIFTVGKVFSIVLRVLATLGYFLAFCLIRRIEDLHTTGSPQKGAN